MSVDTLYSKVYLSKYIVLNFNKYSLLATTTSIYRIFSSPSKFDLFCCSQCLSPTPVTTDLTSLLYRYAFSGKLYNWNHRIYSLLCLSSFPKQNAFEIYSCCGMSISSSFLLLLNCVPLDKCTTVWSFIQFSSVQSLSRVRLFATPWIAACQASLSFTNSQSSLRLTSIESVIQPSHPLSSPFPPTPNPSQHQSLFQWVNSSHEVAKVLEFQL